VLRLWLRRLGSGHIVAFAAGPTALCLFYAAAALLFGPKVALVASGLFALALLVLGVAAYAVLRDRHDVHGGPGIPRVVAEAMVRERERLINEPTQPWRIIDQPRPRPDRVHR